MCWQLLWQERKENENIFQSILGARNCPAGTGELTLPLALQAELNIVNDSSDF